MEKNTYVRHVAVKIPLRYVTGGTFTQDDGESPAYLLAQNQTKIYRLNVLATILSKEVQGTITNLYVDDGTGKVVVRSFEPHPELDALSVGKVVLVIGKVRVYNQEKYISPEIIKKVPASWLAVRILELGLTPAEVLQSQLPDEPVRSEPTVTVEEVVDASDSMPRQKIIILIKELDLGSGALMDDVIEKSALPGTEQLLEKMLQSGDIFQIVPGRVKVL